MSHSRSGAFPALTRRRVLGAVAGGGAASLLPPSVHRAMARPMRVGGLRAVEHVIVFMQENRAYDHYFGSLRGARGFGDTAPLRRRDGSGTVFDQSDDRPGAARTVRPFSLRRAAAEEGRPAGDIQYLDALAHGFDDATQAWHGGWWDDWVPAKTDACMTYYDRRDIALQYELADTFTFCDAYHCSVFGSTNPNRTVLWSGKIGYEPGSRDRAVTNVAYDYTHPGYDWTSYVERLEDHGVGWQIYQEWDNFTDNAVEYFVRFKRVGDAVLRHVDGGFHTTEEFYDSLAARTPADRQAALAQFERGVTGLDAADRSLFERGMRRSRPGTLRERLAADIEAGTLPAVSYLVPPAAESEHPSVSTPVGSANLVYDVLDLIASEPKVWDSTVLLINFDENDGYFDHVPPPVQPRPREESGDTEWFDGRPIGLGPRVPMTVVSPWTVGGHVSSEVFDHSSVIQLLERWTGVREPNISAWRRQATGDLTSTFDFEHQSRPQRLTAPGSVPAPVDRWHPVALDTGEAHQEPGRRRTRPLPYRPSAQLWLVDGAVELDLGNAGPSSAHFALYPYAGELTEVEHVDVVRRVSRRLRLPHDRYDLAVQGPNRFWVEARGRLTGPAEALNVVLRSAGRRLELVLVNDGTGEVEVEVVDARSPQRQRRLVLRRRSTRRFAWPTDQGWYDLSVTVPRDPSYRRHFTGRVEDGRSGVTP